MKKIKLEVEKVENPLLQYRFAEAIDDANQICANASSDECFNAWEEVDELEDSMMRAGLNLFPYYGMRYGSLLRKNFKLRFNIRNVEDHHVIPVQFRHHPIFDRVKYDLQAGDNIIMLPREIGNLRENRVTHNGPHHKYNMFVGTDANMVEVNPLILTKEEKIVCLDAKVNFDSNALFRHPEIVELRDLNEEDPTEIEASKHDLAYIKLDGSIGCMVNGAGLAMATMDIIKLYGKEPANFLDVGGGASKEKVSAALKIILSDKNVKGILINIFGGIMRCDVLAQGVVDAAKEINISVPLVVRLAGTNFQEGKEILDNSGLELISAENLDDAAKKIVKAIK